MSTEKKYIVDFLLREETYFEEKHYDYDGDFGALRLSIPEIVPLLELCREDKDVIGISIPSTRVGSDTLEIVGIDGDSFDLKLDLTTQKGFVRHAVRKEEVVSILHDFESIRSRMDTDDAVPFLI